MKFGIGEVCRLEGLNVLISIMNGEIEKPGIVFEKEFSVMNQRVVGY